MIYISVILLMRIVQSVFDKKSSLGVAGKTVLSHYIAYRQIVSALLALLFLLLFGESLRLGALAAILSVVTGVSIVVAVGASLTAMKSGTIVLTNLFSAAGLLIPCVAGIFLFDEKISLPQAAGIVILMVSAYLLIGCSKAMYKNFSLKTLLLLLTAMLSNGVTMLAQKMFSLYCPDASVLAYSFLSFASSGVILLIFLLFTSLSVQKRIERLPGKLLFYGFALSAAVFVISQLSTVAAKTIPSILLFPITNGGGLIITAIIASAVFGEKHTVKSVAGIVTGIASLIVINLF